MFLKKKNNQAIPEKETESKQNEKRPKRKKLRIQGGPLVSSREYQIRVRLRVERG